MASDQCLPIKEQSFPTREAMEHLLLARRSIRSYEARPVDPEILTRLINIARYAPSGHNTQPVRWLVIHSSQEVQRLAGLVIDWMRLMLEQESPLAQALHMDRLVTSWEDGEDRICRGAPHVVLVHSPKDERTAPAACTIALTYLELAVLPFGLGACWAGYLNTAVNMWPPMAQALDLPLGRTSFGAMMVGYPKYAYHRIPLRKQADITWR
jgi:nitroreductase